MSEKKIPKNWTTLKLGEVGDWQGGGTPSKSNPAFWTNGTIPWVSPKDMKVSKISCAQDRITETAVSNSATNRVGAGSVLLVTRSGILAHSLPVAINLVPVALNQDIKAVTPYAFLDPEFLLLAFSGFEREILNECRKGGTTVHSIEFPALKDFPLPLPPLAEQKRIAAKIEELFSELDAGEASLRKAREQLGVYRQSLLKQAFEGKLTAQWRKANPDKLESPDILLARIQSERQARYEQRINEWKKRGSTGKRPSKPKDQSDTFYKVVADNDLPYPLPDSWAWCLFRVVCDFANGDRGKNYPNRSEYVSEGIPWINTGHIEPDGSLSRDRMHFITREKFEKLNGGQIEPHDLAYCLRGATFGKTAFVRPYLEGAIASSLMIVRPVQPESCSYIFRFLLSPLGKSQLQRFDNGSAQPNLSAENVGLYFFPLCSLPEQQEIVRLLDAQFEVIEQNEREIDAALKRSEALRQSILKKAFSGQLVPQDPSDEPASALLERIRAERKAAAKSPARGGRGGRKRKGSD